MSHTSVPYFCILTQEQPMTVSTIFREPPRCMFEKKEVSSRRERDQDSPRALVFRTEDVGTVLLCVKYPDASNNTQQTYMCPSCVHSTVNETIQYYPSGAVSVRPLHEPNCPPILWLPPGRRGYSQRSCRNTGARSSRGCVPASVPTAQQAVQRLNMAPWNEDGST
jgi:hypothetical protein